MKTQKKKQSTQLSLLFILLVMIVALGCLMYPLIFGSLSMQLTGDRKLELLIQIVAALATLIAVFAAIIMSRENLKYETERANERITERTQLIARMLSSRLSELYVAYQAADQYHYAFLRNKKAKNADEKYLSTLKDAVLAYKELSICLRRNPFKVLGDNYEVCSEIDQKIGLLLWNLGSEIENHFHTIEYIFSPAYIDKQFEAPKCNPTGLELHRLDATKLKVWADYFTNNGTKEYTRAAIDHYLVQAEKYE